ncbi:MAG: hypothetical protein EKK39_14450 [Sphingobacteriales bacterium]|uniref:hypothetical protein n=1 Tax=Hydrotalea flava TaxID=714549 RepID=UPI0008312945|nr:hypothetical protein [Hydrotalea flava]RTL47358.1 MAG: hypothetical protein EKK39_14450 [Sphingobacteriales bacterium]
MIIFDFLVYHLTQWFEQRKKRLAWNTPLEQAIYGVVIALTGIFVIVEINLEDTIWAESNFKTPAYLVVIVALIIYYSLVYVYVKKGRYEKIINKNFGISKKVGIIISLAIFFFCTVG